MSSRDSRYDDRRHSSSSRSHSYSRRDRDSSRRSSPGPSRGRSPPPVIIPRDDNELPVEFGRPMESTSKEDENTVIRRMKTAFTHSPLNVIYRCIQDNEKIKIWTRNFKEVRGICTGYVIAFDKHWNLILSDVEEVYLKPKKAKTPFLMDPNAGELPELPPKTPRVKKAKASSDVPAPSEEKPVPEGGKDKPKKKKKKGRKINKRHLKQLFVRGDNIVMIAVLDVDEASGEQTEN